MHVVSMMCLAYEVSYVKFLDDTRPPSELTYRVFHVSLDSRVNIQDHYRQMSYHESIER